jgi:hypothetical protein
MEAKITRFPLFNFTGKIAAEEVHDETGKPYSSSAQRHHSHHSFTAG